MLRLHINLSILCRETIIILYFFCDFYTSDAMYREMQCNDLIFRTSRPVTNIHNLLQELSKIMIQF